jgi:ADP-heptose:LPS heptosyltransferase
MHAVDRNWKMVEALGVGDLPKRFHVPIVPGEVESVQAELNGLPRPWLAVAIGAKWVTKRWPPSHYAELLRRAQEEFGGTCLLLGTSEDSKSSAEVMNSLHGPSRDLIGKTSLTRFAALLSLCDVMVGNDTGSLHLGAALGRPCVAPYTCTRVALHGPYTWMKGGVETSVPCGGSYRKSCPDMICMPELTPERLWPKLAEILNAWLPRQLGSHSA